MSDIDITPPEAQSARRGRSARKKERQKVTRSEAVSPGLLGGRYKPLTDEEVALVHETALSLLENTGLSQAIPSMVEKVVAAGGKLTEDKRLLFPRKLIETTLKNARRDIVLFGRKSGYEMDISGSRVHVGSGGASPNIVDLETGCYRGATVKDLYDSTRIIESMEHIHFHSRNLVCRDAENPLDLDVNTAFACLSGTTKHIFMSASEPQNIEQIKEICYAMAGGEEAFRERPFLSIHVCHVVPPMRFAEEACDTLERAILAGFPVQLISAGQAGATSPASIAGSLVQAIAECLAGLAFAQLVDPNVQAIFAPKPLVADLRTGSMCGGGGEQAVLMAAAAQMGRYYDLPTSSIAGITDSKVSDAQAGYEKNLAVTLAAHAGANIITQSCGMHASLLGVSLEAYVIDNDMLGGILRSIRGVEVTVESLAAEVIDEVVRGEGHYLGHNQTLSRMESDYVYPAIGDRRSPSDWEDDGSKDARERGRDKAREILNTVYPNYIPKQIEEDLRRRFNILLTPEQMGRV
ncbi:MAG: trimethylamine methyltransferase family protein [Halopseudomonas aestusnigri]